MSVQAIRAGYHGTMKDTADHYRGQQLLYIGWDRHLMFAAPLCIPIPPQTPFGALPQAVLPGLYGQHPQFAGIDWATVTWQRDGEAFTPEMGASLADNGIGHKSVLRFRTPGQDGLADAAF